MMQPAELCVTFSPQHETNIRATTTALVIHFPSGVALQAWSFHIVERQVLCGTNILDLARSPMMLKVFKLFCRPGDPQVQREALLYVIYGRESVLSCSERMLESYRANAVKLMSRARRLAERYVSPPYTQLIEWFPYDYASRRWSLLKLRSW
jgi:hypothetical protein